VVPHLDADSSRPGPNKGTRQTHAILHSNAGVPRSSYSRKTLRAAVFFRRSPGTGHVQKVRQHHARRSFVTCTERANPLEYQPRVPLAPSVSGRVRRPPCTCDSLERVFFPGQESRAWRATDGEAYAMTEHFFRSRQTDPGAAREDR